MRKNCNSFCIVLAGELGADPIPTWTHRLGDGAAALDDRARRVFAAFSSPAGPGAPEPTGPAVIVWDDHGEWHSRHFETVEEAKATWDALSLTHASVCFVKTHRATVGDIDASDEDEPAWAWTVLRTYGLPHAVKKIRDRFSNSRAMRRHASTSTRAANKLLRPKRRPIADQTPPTP